MAPAPAGQQRLPVRRALPQPGPVGRRRLLLGLCATLFVLSILRDAVLLELFYYAITSDSNGYLSGEPLRSRPYPLLAALAGASPTGNPIGLIWLQIGLAACAAVALVYVIGRTDLWLASGVALLVLFDLNWAITSRWVMTESAFTSFHLLSLACLVLHFERRQRLPWWELAAAGALYGWTLTIRPSGLFLALPILLGYVWFTRSWRQTGLVAGGLAALLLVTALVTQWQTGHLRLWSNTGIAVAFPLFTYQLYAPANGPTSQRFDEMMRACYPDIDYAAVDEVMNNEYIWRRFAPCLDSQHGMTVEQSSGVFVGLYVEALRHDPVRFLRTMFDRNGTMLEYPIGYPLATLETGMGPTTCPRSLFAWCDDVIARAGRYPPGAKAEAARWQQAIGERTAYTTQAHLSLVSKATGQPLAVFTNKLLENWAASGAAILLAWLLVVGVALVGSRPAMRVMVAACVVLLHYTMLSVVMGQVFIGRYVVGLGPFYDVISVAFVLAAVRLAVQAARLGWTGAATLRSRPA